MIHSYHFVLHVLLVCRIKNILLVIAVYISHRGWDVQTQVPPSPALKLYRHLYHHPTSDSQPNYLKAIILYETLRLCDILINNMIEISIYVFSN